MFLEKNRKKEERIEYIFAIIFALIFLYIFNNLLNWNVYFVTTALNEVLWIINLSIVVSIIGYALLLLYNPVRFRHLIKLIINIINFIAVYYVYKVFPFDFNNSFYNWGLNILLILIMVATAIAIIVEFYLLVTGRPKLTGN